MAETVIKIEYDTDEAQKAIDDLALKIDGLTESNKVYQKLVKDARADLKKTDDQLKQEGKSRENLINTIQKGTVRVAQNKDAIAAARKERAQNIRLVTGEKTAFEKLTDAVHEGTEESKKHTAVLGNMQEKLSQTPGPIGGIIQGFKGMTKAAWAFVANPIGAVLTAIVGAITLLVKGLKRTEEGQNKLNKVTAVFKGILNAVMNVISDVANAIMSAFEDPQQAVKDLWEVIKTNIVNRFVGLMDSFKALGKIIAASFKFDWDTVRKQSEILGESVIQTLTGVDNLVGKVADGFAKMNEKINEGISVTQQLTAAEAELVKMQRDARLIQLEYQKEAEKLRQIRDDESRSIDERIEANRKLGEVLKEQLSKELDIANQALLVANLRIKAEGESTDNLNEKAEALTNIADIQERITGQESEQLVNINSLLREKADLEQKAAEEARKRQEDEAKRRGEAIAKLAGMKQQELELEAKSFQEKRDLQTKFQNDEYQKILDQQQKIKDQLAIETDEKKKTELESQLLLDEELELAKQEHNNKLAEIEKEYQENIRAQRQMELDNAFMGMQEIISTTAHLANQRVNILSDAFSKIATINFKEVSSAKDAFIQIGSAAQGLTALITSGNQAQLEDLEAKKQAELEAVGDNTAAREQIEKKYNDRLIKVKKAQFKEEKKKATVDAIIATALAIAKALPNIPLSILAGVLGGVQIATIRGQAEPEFSSNKIFARGGVIADGASHANGGINVFGDNGQYFGNVEGNEAMFVMKKDATAEIAAMSAINESHGGRSFNSAPVKHAAEGGQLSGNDIASMVDREIIRTPIFVKVGDIEMGLTETKNVRNAGVI